MVEGLDLNGRVQLIFGFTREQRPSVVQWSYISSHIHTHIHTQFGRQPATSFNSTGIWIYERTALRPVERKGALSHQLSSMVISGHQRSSTVISGHQWPPAAAPSKINLNTFSAK
jgi:hypothetical protein